MGKGLEDTHYSALFLNDCHISGDSGRTQLRTALPLHPASQLRSFQNVDLEWLTLFTQCCRFPHFGFTLSYNNFTF